MRRAEQCIINAWQLKRLRMRLPFQQRCAQRFIFLIKAVLWCTHVKCLCCSSLQRLRHKGKLMLLGYRAQVDLDEFACHEDQDRGPCTFTYPCRCGNQYFLSEQDLSETSDHVLVQCFNCSLVIRVVYTVAADHNGAPD
jgi:hypothetical protein